MSCFEFGSAKFKTEPNVDHALKRNCFGKQWITLFIELSMENDESTA